MQASDDDGVPKVAIRQKPLPMEDSGLANADPEMDALIKKER